MTNLLANWRTSQFAYVLDFLHCAASVESPAGRIPARLYVPKTERGLPNEAPACVYYHGRGFVGGDLESHDALLRALANRGRCIVVSVADRLAPDNPYPAPNNDAWTAPTWVADHASQIGADSQRLAVGGDGAGGLLAAWAECFDHVFITLRIVRYQGVRSWNSRPSPVQPERSRRRRSESGIPGNFLFLKI